jgi:NTP pyrophosphatase (non-canonical NTP hydrolase)
MDNKTYTDRALLTWNPPKGRDKILDILYLSLGLGNEAGEVQGKLKKVLRGDNHNTDDYMAHVLSIQDVVVDELGDTLWYLTMLALELGYSLDQIMEANIRKLADRKDRGVIKGSGDNR